ncbi:hypothetical protein GMST_15540 [Geomonas silvestris]|uniref:DNA primase/polymerase bifunctional N-terminal domain-containing protein n=1 Tax=Geomonas silvestris TaxID=2740184 RepID=A0A6V8MHV0_9BACT|nr:bifunctional DNA primase/polymerase [Geomonas silvestris]GFO59229.1 hypothetical protein GMST_15540 [Geomonas silvestris]
MEKINMKQAALDYAGKGIAVFPLWQNGKAPLTKNGFKDATTDPIVINQLWSQHPDANIGVPTGAVTGWLVVDVDNKNGVLGSDTLKILELQHGELPGTRQHSTPSGGYHLLFKRPNREVPCSAGKLGPGLDVRCEGGYIVAPPSVIDGGRYQALNMCETLADAPEWLVDLAVAKKAVSSSAEGMKEGGRNQHIFNVAIGCNKQGMAYEDAVEAVVAENRRCDPPLEVKEVQRTLDSAYRYEVSDVQPEIEELNRNHAVVMVGGKCRVLKEATCPVFNWPDIELSAPKDFKEFYSNRYTLVAGKQRKLGDTWFSHPNRRQYEGLIFNPGGTPKGYYNLWRGFAVEPVAGDCSLYLKHVEENIANGNKEIYDYIIGWMAHTVQHPDELVGTAIVMRGAMGVGKGVFANGFGSLFGRHYLPMNQSSQLTGKFNAHMKDVVVLLADEAFWAGDKAAEGVLKGLITEPFLTIEGKGDKAFKMKNHLHMMFATNNDWCVPAGPNERRFFVVDVSDKHQQDHVYFGAIEDEMKDGGREALLHYLMNYDLGSLDLRKFPKTSALLETKLMSLTPAQKFWYHVLETGNLLPNSESGWQDGIVESQWLYDMYVKFLQDIGVKHKASDTELGMQLGKMVASGFKKGKVTISKGVRKNCYTFQSLAECRSDFDKFINSPIDWPTEE